MTFFTLPEYIPCLPLGSDYFDSINQHSDPSKVVSLDTSLDYGIIFFKFQKQVSIRGLEF